MHGRCLRFPRSAGSTVARHPARAAPAQRLMHRALCGALLSASLLARASATVRRCPCHRAAWCPPLPALTPGRAGIDVSRLHRLHGACCARAAPRRCRQRQLQPRLTRISRRLPRAGVERGHRRI
jgi:hypothetical protein